MCPVRSSCAILAALMYLAPVRARGDEGRDVRLRPYLLAGGGVALLSSREARSLTSAGGTLDMRLGLRNRSYMGAELACVWTMIPQKHSRRRLVSAGAEAVVRLQYPYASPRWLVEPFLLTGLGWSSFTLTDGHQGVTGSDVTGDVLLGGGLTLGRGPLLLDARLTYRASFDEQLRLGGGQKTVDLNRWTLAAYMGCTF